MYKNTLISGNRKSQNNNSFNSSNEHVLQTGCRVTLRIGAFGSHYFDNPRYNRHGVIVDKVETGGYFYSDFSFLIALDCPVNQNPTDKELELTELYNIPGNGYQTKLIKITNGVAENIMTTTSELLDNSLHICKQCKGIKVAQGLLRLPSNYAICAEHILPYNSKLNIPDVSNKSFTELMESLSFRGITIQEIFKKVDGEYSLVITKALANTEKWSNCKNDYERVKLVNSMIESKFYLYMLNGLGLSMEYSSIDNQLFKNRNRYETYIQWLTVSTESSSVNQLPVPTLTDSNNVILFLRKYGYDDNDFKKLLKEYSADMINKMDRDILLTVIASIKANSNVKEDFSSNRLKDDITIIYQYPINNNTGSLILYKNTDFNQMIQKLSDHLKNVSKVYQSSSICPINYSNQSINETLYIPIVSEDNFDYTHISSKEQLLSTIDKLFNNGTIYISSSNDNFGPISPFLTLSMELKYNNNFTSKVKKLSDYYSAWRGIRGDGNCYYRTVIFALIEQIIQSKQRYKLNLLSYLFQTVCVDKNIDDLCKLLKQAAEGLIWRNFDEFISQVVNSNDKIDLALIKACRTLVSNYLIVNENKLYNGITLKDSILPSYPDVSDMAMYCALHVDQLGEDAEGPLVMLGILPQCLSCASVIVFLKSDQSDTFIMESYPDDIINKNSVLGTIHLLLRPGHYDLLYPKLPNQDDGRPGISSELLMSYLNDTKVKKVSEEFLPMKPTSSAKRIIISSKLDSLLDNDGLCKVNDIKYRQMYLPALPWNELKIILSDIIPIHIDRLDKLINNERNIEYSNNCNDNDRYELSFTGIIKVFIRDSTIESNKDDEWLIDLGQFNSINEIIKELLDRYNYSNGYNLKYQSTDILTWSILMNEPKLTIINFKNILIDHIIKGVKVIKLQLVDNYFTLEQKVKEIYNINNYKKILLLYNQKNLKNLCDINPNQNLFDIINNGTIILQYCESDFGCYGKVDEVICIDGCKHIICYDCIENHLNSIADVPRPILGAELMEPNAKNPLEIRSIFQTPNANAHELPKLREIKCLVDNCVNLLSDDSLQHSIIYQNDISRLYNEIDHYNYMRRTFRECDLNYLLYCCDQPEPLSNFIQLGCGHFFHPGCISSYLKNAIGGCKQKLKRLVCPVCEENKSICYCLDCGDRDCCHIFTQPEVNALIGSGHFTQKDRDDYLFLMSTFYLSNELKREKFVRCNKGGCNIPCTVPTNQKFLDCAVCRFKTCLECNSDFHDGMSCEEFKRSEELKVISQSGEMLQSCPGCGMSWGVVLNCVHSTCDKANGGCGEQFCFFCSAPYLPTLMHSNFYHRPNCSSRGEQCCDKKCTTELKLANCEQDKYSPGPCAECIKFEDIRLNSCTHREWRPCRSCLSQNKICKHWCSECTKLGKLCKPPINNNHKYKIYTKEQVENEQLRLKPKK